MPSLILNTAELDLSTRRKTRISNRLDRSPAIEGYKNAVRDYRKKYHKAVHRDVGPCATFNCHGLTFGSRRTWIDGSKQIETILQEDDYEAVQAREALPGDIAIYTKDGQIEHSGIVVEAGGPLNQPKILSKWAHLHEVVHLTRLPNGMKNLLVSDARAQNVLGSVYGFTLHVARSANCFDAHPLFRTAGDLLSLSPT